MQTSSIKATCDALHERCGRVPLLGQVGTASLAPPGERPRKNIKQMRGNHWEIMG